MQSQAAPASFDSYLSPSPHGSVAGPSLGEAVGGKLSLCSGSMILGPLVPAPGSGPLRDS